MKRALRALLSLLLVLSVALAFVQRRRHKNTLETMASPAAFDVLPRRIQVPEFSLTNQDGQPMSRGELKGSIWVAAFIFTRCSGTCPVMVDRMLEVDKALAGTAGLRLVCISCDPEYDTPERLKQYMAASGIASARWSMLTGDRAVIQSLSRDGFKLSMIAAKDAPELKPVEDVIHSQYLVLVDSEGWIRGYFAGLEVETTAKIAAAVAELKREEQGH